jgi:hypothetical protein
MEQDQERRVRLAVADALAQVVPRAPALFGQHQHPQPPPQIGQQQQQQQPPPQPPPPAGQLQPSQQVQQPSHSSMYGQPPMAYGHMSPMYSQQPMMYGQPSPVFSQQPMMQRPPMYNQQPHMYGQQPHVYGQQPPMYGQQPPLYGQQPAPPTPLLGGTGPPLNWVYTQQLDTILIQEQLQQECRNKVKEAEQAAKSQIEDERLHNARMTALRNLKAVASPTGSYPSTPGSGQP